MFKTSSSMDGGTLFQLRNLINRRNILSSPDDNVNASEDFFELVTKAHILAAAMEVFGMSSLSDAPDPSLFPPGVTDDKVCTVLLESGVSAVMSQFVDLSYPPEPRNDASPIVHVQEYAKEALTLGLFHLEFHDAVREGDGLRVLRCWKFLLLFFKSTRHPNYSVAAITLLAQYYYLLPPRLSEQLIWTRFVNTCGKRGHNISADLQMEHLNRTCKDMLANLGANKTPKAIVRAGKAAGMISEMLAHFDAINRIDHGSGEHTRRSELKDLTKIVDEIHGKLRVFGHTTGRKHSTFPTYSSNTFRKIDSTKLNAWMKEYLTKVVRSSKLNQ